MMFTTGFGFCVGVAAPLTGLGIGLGFSVLRVVLTVIVVYFLICESLLVCIECVVIHGLKQFTCWCFFSVFLFSMAAPAWISALSEAKVPEQVQSKLVAMGYETADSFHFKDERVFEAFVKKFLVVEKEFGKLKVLWLSAKSSVLGGSFAVPKAEGLALALPSPVSGCGLAGALVGLGKLLSALDRDKMRRDVENKYSGAILTLESLPCMSLNAVYLQRRLLQL